MSALKFHVTHLSTVQKMGEQFFSLMILWRGNKAAATTFPYPFSGLEYGTAKMGYVYLGGIYAWDCRNGLGASRTSINE